MSQMKLGLRLALINSFAAFPLLMFGAPAGGINEPVVEDGLNAQVVLIPGVGRLDLSHLGVGSSVRISRAQPATKNRISVDAAVPAQFALKAGLKDTNINFQLFIESEDARGEMAAKNGREQRYIPLSVEVYEGDTPAIVLERLFHQLNAAVELFPEVDGQGEQWVASFAAGKLTVDAKDPFIRLTLRVDTIDVLNARQVTAFAPVTEIEQDLGTGNYNTLKSIILPTAGSNEVWGLNGGRYLPLEGTNYTCIDISTITPREDLHGGAGAASELITQNPQYRLYIAEGGGNDDGFDNLLKFLNKATGSKTWVKADGTPGTAANSTFVVDSTDPATVI